MEHTQIKVLYVFFGKKENLYADHSWFSAKKQSMGGLEQSKVSDSQIYNPTLASPTRFS